MGYETEFILYADSQHDEIADYLATRREPDLDYLGGFYVASRGEPRWFGGKWKWYRHDDDMGMLSANFPDVTFILEGVGEEHPDIWRKFYKNGKIIRKQKAVITFEDEDGNVVHR
jgi:hypothetical protein